MAMSDENVRHCLDSAQLLAREAGEMIRLAFNKEKTVTQKSCRVDLVTETDRAVEQFLFKRLRQLYPDHKFIGEESVAAGDCVDLTDAPTWIVDPVDGTMNFVHSFPFVCVSIGLTVQGRPEVGVVYNPVLDQMYHARRGHGAFLNGQPIQASGQTDLSQALVIGEMGTSTDPEKVSTVFTNIKTLVPKVHGVRSLGSCALDMCCVACGAADVYHETGVHCWDMAAAAVILREAAATVVDTAGGEFDLLSRRVLCAGSEQLAADVSTILKQYQAPRD